jgi:seryl-tRNA synthetase
VQAEAGRRSGQARRGEVTPNQLPRALVKSGATQGIASVCRQLERQRGEEQLALEEIAARRTELEAAVAELEAQRERIEDVNSRYFAEQEELEARVELLHETLAADQHELVGRLCALHNNDGLEPVLIELNVFDVVGDDAAA